MRHFFARDNGFPFPEEAELAFPERGESVGKKMREKGSLGGGWMYNSC